ncbi:DUF1972 domain-containing protein [Photobacterium damselae subsp. damselae]|uniref:DUF1972 domain-containing protein n=1 Tax=Photobacterium damselae TaxID=38293 RepID=UPI001F1ABCFD|nr:DUF1972 domain-containing protein [Photobacterium damselae]UKA26086.1 DUF1972 domain-containing protein [Photobacterium damselae subsp. damselae]
MNNGKLSLSVIGTVGVPAVYGGFESLVDNLLDGAPGTVDVYCSSKAYEIKLSNYKGANLVYIPLKANGISSVFYDVLCMLHCLFTKPKTVLILGVSGCIFLPLFSFFSNAKIVTNIDGLEWKRDKWSHLVKRFLKFSEKLAVRYSDVIISDNKAIYDYVLSEYDVYSEIIAYGGDHALNDHQNENDDKKYSLALCRIEPENNVEMILEAFSKINKKLVFIGNWNNSFFGKQVKAKYSVFNNIELLDPIYDMDKLFYIRSSCSNYIHGHSAGGTNPSLVEMMHFSKPIYCFDCSYNRATTDNLAVYFNSAGELSKLLNDNSVECTGEDMLRIAKERYTWNIIRKNIMT